MLSAIHAFFSMRMRSSSAMPCCAAAGAASTAARNITARRTIIIASPRPPTLAPPPSRPPARDEFLPVRLGRCAQRGAHEVAFGAMLLGRESLAHELEAQEHEIGVDHV